MSDQETKHLYSLKPGHPPVDTLKIRFTWSTCWKPDPKDYSSDEPGFVPPTDNLGRMQFEADGLAEGAYGTDDLLHMAAGDYNWELVDDEGVVWTERVELNPEPLVSFPTDDH